MKNIKEIRNQELAARAEEEARAARQAELDALPEKNVISTMPDVRAGTIRADRDEEGNPKGGISGGKYITKNINGVLVSGETEEELNKVVERMNNGIKGDGFLYKDVDILGHRVTLVGRNEEELEIDHNKALVDFTQHKGHIGFDVVTAEDFNNSGYGEADEPELEQVEVQGCQFVLAFKEFRAIDINEGPNKYNTAVEVTDLPSVIAAGTRKEIKALLLERLENYVETTYDTQEEEEEFTEEDCEESENDEGEGVNVEIVVVHQ